MRSFWLALLGLALAGPSLLAQQPPPAAPAAASKLDEALLKWERAMGNVTSLAAQCSRTTIDKTYQSTDTYDGVAKYLRVGNHNLASLEMYKRGKRDVFEKWICSGTVVYEYAPQTKEIRVHDLPKPPPGQVADDNFMSFLFGMKAAEARRRYQLTWVQPPPNDRWYYYIDVRPIQNADKQDFSRARLVLNAATFLPRQLWFEQPNGNEVTWDFPQMQTGAQVNARDFGQPAVPAGWRMVRAPAAPQSPPARVIRQQQ
jgi:TIGR03009 family protein